MKTIFITGSNSGIGLETAKLFASKGWRVIATMRNLGKAGELKNIENVVIMPLDLNNSAQIRETCQKALKEYDVDVLLNNAGYAIMGPLESLAEDDIRKLYDANVIGTTLVTQQFIPHFKARKSGVIMVTTSLAGIIGLPRDGVYGASKRALQGLVESIYYELKPYGVQVKAMIPGGTKTNFQIPINIVGEYEEVMHRQRMFILNGEEEFPDGKEAAEVIWTAATDGEDKMNYATDHVCQILYDKYLSMGIEDFKVYFSNLLYDKK
ncbi:NAD(P)-binding protein [Neocallimastix lanati (nom. inval.)]|uniref:NAD(P)-binding protein n=1 Tax=Neocallimastix californiae TaxID=1754190 RepID=A0A1Y2E9U7_9FUNG|nr:NAD(P)-binding protein [Neocallimastix sp. JGI-2020a]ORY68016.1 NAD(P)-binding protein [Neocallimastix californiae]|eukprot:ORY68016.1 NAD(P)-binding protein [Neocallimastix californiae]